MDAASYAAAGDNLVGLEAESGLRSILEWAGLYAGATSGATQLGDAGALQLWGHVPVAR